jgi:hypothetical protein
VSCMNCWGRGSGVDGSVLTYLRGLLAGWNAWIAGR